MEEDLLVDDLLKFELSQRVQSYNNIVEALITSGNCNREGLTKHAGLVHWLKREYIELESLKFYAKSDISIIDIKKIIMPQQIMEETKCEED